MKIYYFRGYLIISLTQTNYLMKSKIHECLSFNNPMSKNVLFLLVLVFTFNLSIAQEEKSNTMPTPNYRAAAKYSPTNLGKLVHSTSVRPRWLKNGNRFWYQYKTSEGSEYYIVDPDNRSKKELFDNEKMAQWLTEITKDPYDAIHKMKYKKSLLMVTIFASKQKIKPIKFIKILSIKMHSSPSIL